MKTYAEQMESLLDAIASYESPIDTTAPNEADDKFNMSFTEAAAIIRGETRMPQPHTWTEETDFSFLDKSTGERWYKNIYQPEEAFFYGALKENKEEEFVTRLFDSGAPSLFGVDTEGNEIEMTHLMAQSDNLVFPTIRYQDGELYNLPESGQDPYDYAVNNQSYLSFPDERQARFFGEFYKSFVPPKSTEERQSQGWSRLRPREMSDEQYVMNHAFGTLTDPWDYLNRINEKLPVNIAAMAPPGNRHKYEPTWGDVGREAFETKLVNLLSVVPNLSIGVAKDVEDAIYGIGEINYSVLGTMFSKALQGDFEEVERIRATESLRVDKVLKDDVTSLDRMQEAYAGHSNAIYKAKSLEPRWQAYNMHLQKIRKKRSPITPLSGPNMTWGEFSTYLADGMSSQITTVAGASVGLATFYKTKNPKLALSAGMGVMRGMAFALEASDEWQQAFMHYKDLGFSDGEAAHRAHYSAIAYGLGAAAIEGWGAKNMMPTKWQNLIDNDKAILRKIVEGFTGKHTGKIATATNATLRPAAEFLEESSQRIWQGVVQEGYKDVDWSETLDEAIAEGQAGAWSGTIMGTTFDAAQAGLNLDAKIKEAKAANAKYRRDNAQEAEVVDDAQPMSGTKEVQSIEDIKFNKAVTNINDFMNNEGIVDWNDFNNVLNTLKLGGLEAIEASEHSLKDVLYNIDLDYSEDIPNAREQAKDAIGQKVILPGVTSTDVAVSESDALVNAGFNVFGDDEIDVPTEVPAVEAPVKDIDTTKYEDYKKKLERGEKLNSKEAAEWDMFLEAGFPAVGAPTEADALAAAGFNVFSEEDDILPSEIGEDEDVSKLDEQTPKDIVPVEDSIPMESKDFSIQNIPPFNANENIKLPRGYKLYNTSQMDPMKGPYVVSVPGKPVSLTGTNRDFFMHKNSDGWLITEVSTGRRLQSGSTTQKDAIISAQHIVDTVKDFESVIDEAQKVDYNRYKKMADLEEEGNKLKDESKLPWFGKEEESSEQLGSEQISLDINKGQILTQAGRDILGNSPHKVIVNELTQNSIDAGASMVEVYFEEDNRTLRFSDNGSGMSPTETKNNMFVYGNLGSKDEFSAGGYGRAKAAFLLYPDSFKLITTRAGVKTTVSGTREQLMSGTVTMTSSDTSDESGTSLEIVLPESMELWQRSKWKIEELIEEQAKRLKRDVTFEYKYTTGSDLQERTYIAIKEYGETVFPNKSFVYNGNTFEVIFEKVKPYGIKTWTGSYEVKTYVNNKGLNLPEIKLKHSLSRQPNFIITINAIKTVTTDSKDYPFIRNRTELSAEIATGIKRLTSEILDKENEKIKVLEKESFVSSIEDAISFGGVKIVIPEATGESRVDLNVLLTKHAGMFTQIGNVYKKFNDFLILVGEEAIELVITIDPKTHGWRPNSDLLNISPVYAINPFALDEKSIKHYGGTNENRASVFVHTLVHEYTHNEVGNHSEDFTMALSTLYAKLTHTRLGELETDLLDFFERNENEYYEIQDEIKNFYEGLDRASVGFIQTASEVQSLQELQREEELDGRSEESTEATTPRINYQVDPSERLNNFRGKLNNILSKDQLNKGFPLIVDAPNQYDEVIGKLAKLYPGVIPLLYEHLQGEHGQEVAGLSLGALVAFSKSKGTLDTVPHEYMHVFVNAINYMSSMIDSDGEVSFGEVKPTIKFGSLHKASIVKLKTLLDNAMKDFSSEEDMVDAAGKIIAGQILEDKSVTARLKTMLRKFWNELKKFFGIKSKGKSSIEILVDAFMNPEKFADIPTNYDKADNAEDKLKTYFNEVEDGLGPVQLGLTLIKDADIVTLVNRVEDSNLGGIATAADLDNFVFNKSGNVNTVNLANLSRVLAWQKMSKPYEINYTLRPIQAISKLNFKDSSMMEMTPQTFKTLSKGLSKGEVSFLTNVFSEHNLHGKDISVEDFKAILLSYYYPMSIERAIYPQNDEVAPGRRLGVTQMYIDDAGGPYLDVSADDIIDYGEYNITVPFNISRSHPNFTSLGAFKGVVGWYRGDSNPENTKQFRLWEVQSDYFQKNMVSSDMSSKIINKEQAIFLDLVGEGAWEKFFLNSLFQFLEANNYDSVIIPFGETAAGIQGHTNYEENITREKEKIADIESAIKKFEEDDKFQAALKADPTWIEREASDKIFTGIPPAPLKSEPTILKLAKKNYIALERAESRLRDYEKNALSLKSVARRYYKLRDLILKTHKDNARIYTDSDGRQWAELTFSPSISMPVPLYQQIVQGTEGWESALKLIDNLYNEMNADALVLGKKLPLGAFAELAQENMDPKAIDAFQFWLRKRFPSRREKLLSQSVSGPNGRFLSEGDFTASFLDAFDGFEEGLSSIEGKEVMQSARNGEGVERMFINELGATTTVANFAKLMDAAKEEEYSYWSKTSLIKYTGRSLKSLPDNLKLQLKRLYIRANSRVKTNQGSMSNDRNHLVYNQSLMGGLQLKGPVNPFNEKTNPMFAPKMIFEVTNPDLAKEFFWLEKSDLFETADDRVDVPMSISQRTQVKGGALSLEEWQKFEDNLDDFIYEEDDIHGLVFLFSRSEKGKLGFSPIRERHLEIASSEIELAAYWGNTNLTPLQKNHFMGYRDGKRVFSDTKWLAGEIARYEGIKKIMPEGMLSDGVSLFKRVAIPTTPIFTSPMMEATTGVHLDFSNITIVDNNAVEQKAIDIVPGFKDEMSYSDGATPISATTLSLFHNAFGTDLNMSTVKTIVWKGDQSLYMKHDMQLMPAGLKFYENYGKKSQKLVAEVRDDQNIYVDDEMVNMIFSDDEAKIFTGESNKVISIGANEIGLINYASKHGSSKFPMQMFNFNNDEAIIDSFNENVMPKIEQRLKRVMLLSNHPKENAERIYGWLKTLESNDPFSPSNIVLAKNKAAKLGLHSDNEPMLNVLMKTQIISPSLQADFGGGMLVHSAPDWTGVVPEGTAELSLYDAGFVKQLYSKAKGIDSRTLRGNKYLKIINAWLESNPVYARVSRSPIVGLVGAYPVRITKLHDRGNQAVINTAEGYVNLEFDFDGDTLQFEYITEDEYNDMVRVISEGKDNNRVRGVDLTQYPTSAGQYSDISRRENSYVLAEKFGAGARAIGEVSNVQAVHGLMIQTFSYFEAITPERGTRMLTVKPFTHNEEFTETGVEGNIQTIEHQLREWQQAALDNGKFLLLDDWGYTQELLLRKLLLSRENVNGKWSAGEAITDAEWALIKPLIGMYKVPGRIRNGGTFNDNYKLDTLLQESVSYDEFIEDRELFFNKYLNDRELESLGLSVGRIGFKENAAPIEKVAAALGALWKPIQNSEPDRITPIRFSESATRISHQLAVDSLGDLKEDLVDFWLEDYSPSEVREELSKGAQYAMSLHNALVEALVPPVKQGKATLIKWAPRSIASISNGSKTQTSRTKSENVGDTFIVNGVKYIIRSVEKKSMGYIISNDYQAEGHNSPQSLESGFKSLGLAIKKDRQLYAIKFAEYKEDSVGDKFAGHIGPQSWGRNASLIEMQLKYEDLFAQLSPASRQAATITFLEGLPSLNDKLSIVRGNNRNVLPPFSDEGHTTLDSVIMKTYAAKYNEVINNPTLRVQEGAYFSNVPTFNSIVKRMCDG